VFSSSWKSPPLNAEGFFFIIMYFCSCSQWFGWVLVYFLLVVWLFFVTVVLVFEEGL
jgi:hypothetical protein